MIAKCCVRCGMEVTHCIVKASVLILVSRNKIYCLLHCCSKCLILICDEKTTCGEIEETIKKASPLVGEIKLFDIYRGANLQTNRSMTSFSKFAVKLKT